MIPMVNSLLYFDDFYLVSLAVILSLVLRAPSRRLSRR